MRARNDTPYHEFFIAKMINVEWLQWLPLTLYNVQLERAKRWKICGTPKMSAAAILIGNETYVKLKSMEQRAAEAAIHLNFFVVIYVWTKEFSRRIVRRQLKGR